MGRRPSPALALATAAIYRRLVTFDGHTLTKRTLFGTKTLEVTDVSATVHIERGSRNNERVDVYRKERSLPFFKFDLAWWDHSLALREVLLDLGRSTRR